MSQNNITSISQFQQKSTEVAITLDSVKAAIKVLLYGGTGFGLCHKRLSKGQFKQWPTNPGSVVTIEPRQLSLLLQQ